MDERQLPSLTATQMEALQRFASFQMAEDELCRVLAGAFQINFETVHQSAEGQSFRRSASGRFRVPEPGIVITRAHISHALEQKRIGLITERDLVHWATILLMNDAYVLDPGDEDLIAEWLNDISFNLDAG